MAGLKPLFATAPRIKLYIQDKIVAYAVGFNVSISVEVQPVYVLGQYAPISLEPTMYNIVTGTMQIVRLASQSRATAAQAATGQLAKSSETATQQTANSSILSLGGELTQTGDGTVTANSPLSQKELFKHLDPSRLLLSESFDVRLYMKVPTADNLSLKELAWMEIKNCRITSRNTNIAMGQIVNEPLSFQGLLAHHLTDGTVDGSLNPEGDGFSNDNVVKQSVGP